MSLVYKYISQLPNIDNKILILCSGGIDSASLTKIFTKKYGSSKIHLLFVNYGQRSAKSEELCVKKIAEVNEVLCDVINISSSFAPFYNGISSQIDKNIPYDESTARAPGKSHVIYGFASAFCYTHGFKMMATGINFQDNNAQVNFAAHTTLFAEKYQEVLNLVYDPFVIKIISPFMNISKNQIIHMIYELDGNVDYLKNTITCYNPSIDGKACGKCYSCIGRIQAFKVAQHEDPIEYDKYLTDKEIIDAPVVVALH